MVSFRAQLEKDVSKPVSVSSKASAGSGFDDGIDFRSKSGKRELYVLSRRNSFAKRIVHVRANLVFGRGFKIVVDDEKQMRVLDDFLDNMHAVDPVSAFLDFLKKIFVDAAWSGTGWAEKLYFLDGGKKVGLAKLTLLHPLITDFKRDRDNNIVFDEFNNPTHVVQRKDDFGGSAKVKELPVGDSCVLVLDSMGDEVLGISVLESAFKNFHRQMLIQEGIAMGVYRHGLPLHDVTVGNEEVRPTQEMIDNAEAEVSGINYMSEYVHPPWYKLDVKESFSLAGANAYLEPFINDLVVSSGLPEFMITGKGEDANKAVAQEMIRMVDLTIKPLQNTVKIFIESQILKPMMELAGVKGVPRVEWNEILPDYPQDPIKKIKTLAEISVGGKPLVSWDELRELAKFPSKQPNTIAKLSGENSGVYLAEPHGKLIFEGLKKAIVKKRLFSNLVNIPLYLVSGDKVFGIIRLKEPRKISSVEFEKLRPQHKISDKERFEWWPEASHFWYYPVSIIEMFSKPAQTAAPQEERAFISNVDFIKDWKDFSTGG